VQIYLVALMELLNGFLMEGRRREGGSGGSLMEWPGCRDAATWSKKDGAEVAKLMAKEQDGRIYLEARSKRTGVCTLAGSTTFAPATIERPSAASARVRSRRHKM